MSARRGYGLSTLCSCALAMLLTAGCIESKVVEVDKDTFKQEVLNANQPVLVDFDKLGCPLCLPTNAVMEQLADEYQGRAKICHFMIMTPYWTFPAWELKQQYGIYYVPTVILFDKGREVKRWNMMYLADPYRDGLDTALANRPKKATPSTTPAATSEPAVKVVAIPASGPAVRAVAAPLEEE